MRSTDRQFIWAIAATAIIAIIGMTAIIVSDVAPSSGEAYAVLDSFLTYDSQVCVYNGRVLVTTDSHYDTWTCQDIEVKESWRGNDCVRTYTHISTGVKEVFTCSS